MYYVEGQGWFENEPLEYANGQGQSVAQTSGLLRTGDGRLHRAYDQVRGDVSGLLRKWHGDNGKAGPGEQRGGYGDPYMKQLVDFYRSQGFELNEGESVDDFVRRMVGMQSQGLKSTDALARSTSGASLKNKSF